MKVCEQTRHSTDLLIRFVYRARLAGPGSYLMIGGWIMALGMEHQLLY